MPELALYTLLALALANLLLLAWLALWQRARSAAVATALAGRFDHVERQGEALRSTLSDMDRGLREELARGTREGLADAFNWVQQGTRSHTDQLAQFGLSINQLAADMQASLAGLRQDVTQRLAEADTRAAESRAVLLDQVRTGFDRFSGRLQEGQEQLRQTVEQKLGEIRSGNEAKLEQMRVTVDEKLQSTLEQRLGASFRQVTESLERVHQSVGEMKELAVGVGDLKRVLTNVKTRGNWTELGLETMLAEFLTPDQYGRNVEILPRSGQRVEFAIRLPGDEDIPVWLPIDVKFPTVDYERLVQAAERGERDEVETAARAIELRIREAGRDICAKYVQPPHSTDFAVMYLPTEGLFAEVVRRPGLVDAIQRECHVMIAGPTTLATLLSAMRMGFRSLAIQKRSAEVWKVLGAVKHEFSKFGVVLDKVGKKLEDAQKILDDEVGKRHRAMDRKLRAVEMLPEAEAVALLEFDAAEDEIRHAAE